MNTLIRFIESGYPALGPVRSVEPMDVSSKSSRLYLIDSASGDFCLKIPEYERRQGQPQEEHWADWRCIHAVRTRLHQRNVPVEEVLANREGDWLTPHEGNPSWVTRYLKHRPYRGGSDALRSAGRALGIFHTEGLRLLDQETAALINELRTRLVRDMPLAESLAAYPALKDDLRHDDLLQRRGIPSALEPEFALIRDALEETIDPLCRWAAAHLRKPHRAQCGLAHNDYHPDNVLFGLDGRLTILDLEQLSIGPLIKCTALAVTRFALGQDAMDETSAARAFLDGYRQTGPLDTEELRLLPDWIRLYELEKILRILRRTLSGNVYAPMVRKIATHHLWLCRHADRFQVTAP